VKFEIAVPGCDENTEMKKPFRFSVVMGAVVAETEAAQGQTEQAQASTGVDFGFRRARFGGSSLAN